MLFVIPIIFLLSLVTSDTFIQGGCTKITPTSETQYSDPDCQIPMPVVQSRGNTGKGQSGIWASPGGLGASGPVIAQNIYSTLTGVSDLFTSFKQESQNLANLYRSIHRPSGKSTEQINTERIRANEKREKETKEESLKLIRHFDEQIRAHHEPISAGVREENKRSEGIKIQIDEATKQYEKASQEKRAARQTEESMHKAETKAKELKANGLLRWQSEKDDRLKARTLNMPATRIYGQVIRKSINLALSVKQKEVNFSKAFHDADLAIDLLLEADDLLSQKEIYELNILGVKKLEQGSRLAQYTAGKGYEDQNYHDSLSPKAQEQWGLPALDGTTFEGAEIISVVNEADASIYNDELLYFHFASAVRQASVDANDGDTRSVLNNLDRAWAVVNYAKGFSKGLASFGSDTATGTAKLVLHPIDSAQAIYTAVVNYDKTYTAIEESMTHIWNEYENYSAEQKGQLHSKIASEILSTILPIGMLKNVAKISKLEKVGAAVETVVGLTIPIAPKAKLFWSATGRLNSVSNAFIHWRKHASEFPEIRNALEYVSKAKDFTVNPPIETLKKVRSNGDKLFYHAKSNTLVITDAQDAIRTMYKPNPAVHRMSTNMEYFNAQ